MTSKTAIELVHMIDECVRAMIVRGGTPRFIYISPEIMQALNSAPSTHRMPTTPASIKLVEVPGLTEIIVTEKAMENMKV